MTSAPGPSSDSGQGAPAHSREAALAVVHRLRGHGFEALFAGGCVRDMLMGHPPTDYDVATSATPNEVLRLFRRTRAVGRQFGVILVSERRTWIEVATFRSDLSYADGRRPSAITFSTPREDAERRDFTINGMFLDPESDEVIDYVGGRADLAARVIRAIGDPVCRFNEDHLRLLRALRFAARFDYAIEPGTWHALQRAANLLPRVSVERIREELERMLCPPTRVIAWRLLVESGLIPYLWPESHRLTSRVDEIGQLLRAIPNDASFELILAIFTRADPPLSASVPSGLHASNATREGVEWLVRHQHDLDAGMAVPVSKLKRLMACRWFGDLRQLIAARAAAGLCDPAVVTTLEQRVAGIAATDVAPPPLLTGDDLLTLGIPQGPRFRRILDSVYDAQLNGVIVDHSAATQLARELAGKDGD